MTYWYDHDGGNCPVHPNLMGSDVLIRMRGVAAPRRVKPYNVVWRHSGKQGDVLAWAYCEGVAA